MTITCKEAAQMVSEGMDKRLAPEEQLRLRAHLAICRGCQSISERMAFLRRAIKNITDRGDSGTS